MINMFYILQANPHAAAQTIMFHVNVFQTNQDATYSYWAMQVYCEGILLTNVTVSTGIVVNNNHTDPGPSVTISTGQSNNNNNGWVGTYPIGTTLSGFITSLNPTKYQNQTYTH